MTFWIMLLKAYGAFLLLMTAYLLRAIDQIVHWNQFLLLALYFPLVPLMILIVVQRRASIRTGKSLHVMEKVARLNAMTDEQVLRRV